MNTSNLDHARRVLWRITLIHTCVGHPVAAILSRLGMRNLAESVHYHTLPSRVKRKRSRDSLAFSHDPRIFWADAFWGVWASICRALGWDRLAAFFFHRGPYETVREVGAMDYAPERKHSS
jgi:hypothetical protein